MAKQAELKVNVDITPQIAAVARPGDTILIAFDRTLTDDELEQLREDFTGFTDTTDVHIAFVEHVTSMVVVRPDEPVPYELTGKEEGDASARDAG